MEDNGAESGAAGSADFLEEVTLVMCLEEHAMLVRGGRGEACQAGDGV